MRKFVFCLIVLAVAGLVYVGAANHIFVKEYCHMLRGIANIGGEKPNGAAAYPIFFDKEFNKAAVYFDAFDEREMKALISSMLNRENFAIEIGGGERAVLQNPAVVYPIFLVGENYKGGFAYMIFDLAGGSAKIFDGNFENACVTFENSDVKFPVNGCNFKKAEKRSWIGGFCFKYYLSRNKKCSDQFLRAMGEAVNTEPDKAPQYLMNLSIQSDPLGR